MQSPFELTTGLTRLKQIVTSFPPDSPHWSEAENRFQFVDRLLTECLGWEKPNIRVEVSDENGGRSDYILGRPARAILEAKKEAKIFDVPPIGNASSVRKIRPILDSSKIFSEAVKQILPYCTIHGASIAIVCNGPQLSIFQALTPGYSPLDGECFFFDGIQRYIDHFPLLWSLLSPEGITENRASREIVNYRTPRMPPKASETIIEPKKFRYRSEFQENIRVLSSLLLEEVEDNPAVKQSFYKECYIPLEANNRHLLLSKRLITTRYKRVGEDGIAPSALDEIAKADKDGNLITSDEELQNASGSKPIVVLGDVGVGKTSFFENLYEKLEQSEKANTYFININLGTKANLSSDVKTYVLQEIPHLLRKEYNIDINSNSFSHAIYHDELTAFENSPKGLLKRLDPESFEKERITFLSSLIEQKDTHLHASLGHLRRGRKKQIILVMDNADQRNFQVQQEAFLIAQELAATRNVLVFVALRPSTFYQSKTTGALSGYQHKILTISPPPADEVVQRRLAFAVRVAEGKVAPAALSNIRLKLGSVVAFYNATLRSIRTNDSIRFFLSNITGGNTRGVIELITGFFGSPNVDSQKIVRIEEDKGNYRVPLHEFTKHALLGEYAHFNAQSSLVACNIYDVSAADPREHFLASLIVSYLGSNSGVHDNDGFVSGERLLEEFRKFSFDDNQTRSALRRLAAKRLIETPHAHYREIQVPESEPADRFYYRVTSIGLYHIRYWTGSFAFLDAMSTDTPIFDADAREEIARKSSSFDIGDRYDRSIKFRNYLEEQWYIANITCNFYDFPELVSRHDESFGSVKLALMKWKVSGGKTASNRSVKRTITWQ